MTTAESATRMDTSSPDYTGTEKKKPSLLKKVKAKAKKLKSKLKPGQHEPENPNTPHLDNEYTSSAASSGDEEEEEESQELGYTPLSEAVNMDDDKTTAHAAQTGFGGSGLQTDRGPGQAFPEADPSAPITPFKSSGPPGVEQAVPTSYNYYNQDPAGAKTPSPAALGLGGSEGRTPYAPDSGPFGSDISGVSDKPSGEFSSESRDLGGAVSGGGNKPFSHGESGSLQEDKPNTAAADRSSEEDRDAKIPEGILAPGSADTDSRQGRGDDDSFGRKYEQDVGMETPGTKVTGTLAGMKDAALDKVGYGPSDESKPAVDSSSTEDYSSEDQKPLHQRAYEGVTGAAVGMGQKLGAYRDYDHAPAAGDETTTSSSEPTVAQKAYDAILGTKDTAAQKLSGQGQSQQATGEPTVTQKAYDTITGVKDATADKLGVQSGTGTGTSTTTSGPDGNSFSSSTTAPVSEFNSSGSTDTKPVTEKVGETAGSWKDSITGALGLGGTTPNTTTGYTTGTDQKPVTQKLTETGAGLKDTVASKLGYEGSSPSTTGYTTGTDQKPVTQKLTETGAGLKDAVASKLGYEGSSPSTTTGYTTGTDQKPITQKLTETGAGLKDTVASKLGYEGSSTNTPGEEMVQNARGTVVDKARQADVGLSADSTPVSQKAADSAYRAKDSTVSKLTPNEDDKALSESVTESISNLPTLLTEKLGFGGASHTTTKNYQGPSELDVPVSSNPGANTSEGAAAATPTSTPPATSPGIVNRVTGAMSSLFGGAKKPSTGTGEEYSPTSGAGHRDVTDASPMVTDVGRENSPHSSPAA